MIEFNLNEKTVSPAQEDEIKESNELVKKSKEIAGRNRIKKISNIMFITICAVVVMLALRYFKHINVLSEYSTPSDYLTDDEQESSENDSDVNYVDEVVYNPSDFGNEAAYSQNNYKSSLDLNDLNGDSLWYNGSSLISYSWKFMSGYDYKSANIDCVWMCVSDDGSVVYAYRTAIYNGIAAHTGVGKVFENITVYLTKEGGESLGAN